MAHVAKTRIVVLMMVACLALAGQAFASDEHVKVLKHDESGALVDAHQNSPVQVPFTNQLFWEYVAFGLAFLILLKWGFPWMFREMNARQTRIQDALDKADRVRTEAEAMLKKHEKMMADAHAQAKSVTDEAIRDADKARTKILEDAQHTAHEIAERAKREIRMAQVQAMADLRKQAVDLSLLAGTAVLQRSLNDADHRRLAQEAIAATDKAMKN